MTDGSLRLKETARISLSYTEMTSTFPWHHSVTAFCQWTIFRGSYDALRRRVCSMYDLEPTAPPLELCLTMAGLSRHVRCNCSETWSYQTVVPIPCEMPRRSVF